MALDVGSLIINRYRVEEVIAQGGMGSIYRAYDQNLGVQVAIKENLYETEEASRQFRREATLLAGLRHPNLPRVTDHFTIPEKGQYLVMDFIEGEDLRQKMIATGPLSENDVIKIGTAVCEALHYLHTRKPPVVHRDIKPGNIKITSSGQVYLVDFGLAKVAAPGQQTTTGAQALTPGYAPPEQYGQGTTPLSDIYALGATLYAALTGQIPEDGLARAMGTVQLTSILKLRPQIGERIARVVEKAMAVQPEDRYTNADEFRLALLNTLPVAPGKSVQPVQNTGGHYSAPTDSTLHRNGPLNFPTNQLPTVATPQMVAPLISQAGKSEASGRRSYLVWLLPVLLVIVGAGVFFILRNSGGLAAPVPTATLAPVLSSTPLQPTVGITNPVIAPSKTIPAPTQTLPPTASPSPEPFTATPASTFTPAATPLGGGSGILTFASARKGKLPQIWQVHADGSDLKALTDISDGACQPAWSPDGKKLVFITPCAREQDEYPGATIFLINADGTNPEPLPTVPGGDFDPAWSPDGSQIAFTSIREGIAHIFTLQLSDLKVERISGPFSDDRRPVWAPDGKKIAFESTRLGQKQIWIMASTGDSPAEFTRLADGPAFFPAWSADGKILYYNREAGLPYLFARRYDVAQSPESRLSDQRPMAQPQTSKDGQWIVFETWAGTNYDIGILRSIGTNRQLITNDADIDFDPTWKP